MPDSVELVSKPAAYMNDSTRVSLIMLSAIWCAHTQPIRQDYRAVRLELVVPPRIELGQKPSITLKLSNLSDKAIRIPALRSPNAVELDLAFEYLDGSSGREPLGWLATPSVHTTNGAGMRVWLTVPEQMIEISAGEQIQDSIGLSERRPCLRPGHYRVQATYQEAQTVETAFEVPFLPESDMPRLVEMAQGSWPDRYCADILLLAVVPTVQRHLFGDYYPSPDDSRQKIRGHAMAIQRWWDENKSQLRLEKGRFIQGR